MIKVGVEYLENTVVCLHFSAMATSGMAQKRNPAIFPNRQDVEKRRIAFPSFYAEILASKGSGKSFSKIFVIKPFADLKPRSPAMNNLSCVRQ